MSDLIVVAYDNEFKAQEVRMELIKLQKEHLITLEDAVVVIKKENGEVKINQARNLTADGAITGGLWGGLIGLLFGGPLGGIITGTLTAGVGALSGSAIDIGINDEFIKEVGQTITNGTSALFILVREYTPDRVLEDIKPYGGKIIRTNLSQEAEENLRKRLESDPSLGSPEA